MEFEAVLNFSQIPLEIIVEILSRVPVKFLLRLKSVSKFWLSLISSPHFIKMHLNLSANNQDCHRLLILDNLLYDEDKWLYKECPVTSLFVESVIQAVDLDYYPFDDDRHEFYMRALCNGLVLLASFSEESPIEYPILWNPTMRKYKKLSDFRPKLKPQCFPTYGFGYDELHDDYKVVAIMYHRDFDYDKDDSEIQVYSVKSDSWTSVDYSGESLFMNNGAGCYDEYLEFSAVFVDGKLYWNSFASSDVPTARNIISFDIANEKWDTLEKPSFVVGESRWCVDKLGSDLCVISNKETHSDVWVMNKYGVKTSWIRKLTIRYPTGVPFGLPYFISNKGEVFFKDRWPFMIYNSKDDSSRHIDVTNLRGNHDMIIYNESLVSPF